MNMLFDIFSSFKANSVCVPCVSNRSFILLQITQSQNHDYLLACSKPISIFFKPLFRLSHSASDLVCKLSWLPQSLSSRTRLSASPSKFNRCVSKFFILVSIQTTVMQTKYLCLFIIRFVWSFTISLTFRSPVRQQKSNQFSIVAQKSYIKRSQSIAVYTAQQLKTYKHQHPAETISTFRHYVYFLIVNVTC